MPEELQECPVCTLYMRAGITLKEHLDTHPKDQVIDALLKLKHDAKTSQQPPSLAAVPNAAPQMTTAVTYQQILTTNSSGAVVPQFLPVPALVNSPFSISQNMGYAPTHFNPIYNPYIPQPYPFHGVNPPAPAQPAITEKEEQPSLENEEVSSEMDVSDGTVHSPSPPPSPSPTPPPTPSVIITRQRITASPQPASPVASTSNLAEDLPCSSPLPPSPMESSISPSPPASPFTPPLICKPEESVIVEYHQTKPRIIKQEDIKIEKVAEQHPVCLYNQTRRDENEEALAELAPVEIICDSKGQFNLDLDSHKEDDLIFGLSGVDIKIINMSEVEQDNLGFSYSDNAGNCNDSGNSNLVYTDLIPSSTSPLHELLPASSPKILHELLPTTSKNSNTYMVLDSSRMLYVESSQHSMPPSVIQIADSTKPSISPLPLNIAADESMPARGELSEQESLEADCAWALGMFQQDVKLDAWPVETKVFTCSTCNLSLPGLKELSDHKIEFHMARKTGKMFKCVACAAVFGTLRERRSHMAMHAAIKMVKEEGAPSSTQTSSVPALVTNAAKNCPICSVTFLSLKDLRVHLREVHDQIRFKCEECQAGFDEEGDLNEHLKIHPLKCGQCSKLFYRRANLSLHMKRHLLVKPFECSLCAKSFITRQKLEEHVNSHTGARPIRCVQCDKTFSRHSNLIQHRNMHHHPNKRKIKDYVCRCGEIFHSQRKLEWHKELHENKPKSCPYCSQKFIHAASVTRHVRRSHMPEYLPETSGREHENVSCPICDRIYLRSSLSVHMRVHNGDRPFQCNICSKMFTTKWNMELHQWTHQSRSAMPYKCTLCKSAFFREPDYLAHLNAHKNLKPFICNICGQKFIRKYNCLRHQEEHMRDKRFACTVAGCDRVFHRNYYLRDHMKIHTGVRPHTCHICGKASSTKSNHNKHVRIHDTREMVNTEN